MTRRDLERWVSENRDALARRGVRVSFGFSPSLGEPDGPSWASFTSRRGSGRLIRAADGSSRADAYAYADGECLREERGSAVQAAQLESLGELLAARGQQVTTVPGADVFAN